MSNAPRSSPQILSNSDSNAASQYRERLIDRVNLAISDAIDRHCGKAPERLRQAIEYSWMAPGKRLRPLLSLLTAEALGAASDVAMPAAVAVEAIHCYSLIHDDLPAMDDDDLRRGRPTCHIQFDEATAILAGDALQPLAFAVLADGYPNPVTVAKSVQLLAQAAGATALVGGQVEDILAERGRLVDEAMLARIHRGKTGAMICVSVQLGAVAAGATEAEFAALTKFGEAIGLAFQIVDDLLDVESDPETMGKRTGKDAKLGKLTYPGMYGVDASRQRASDLLQEALDSLKDFSDAKSGLISLAKFVYERSN